MWLSYQLPWVSRSQTWNIFAYTEFALIVSYSCVKLKNNSVLFFSRLFLFFFWVSRDCWLLEKPGELSYLTAAAAHTRHILLRHNAGVLPQLPPPLLPSPLVHSTCACACACAMYFYNVIHVSIKCQCHSTKNIYIIWRNQWQVGVWRQKPMLWKLPERERGEKGQPPLQESFCNLSDL